MTATLALFAAAGPIAPQAQAIHKATSAPSDFTVNGVFDPEGANRHIIELKNKYRGFGNAFNINFNDKHPQNSISLRGTLHRVSCFWPSLS